MRILALSSFIFLASSVCPDAGGLYPPGLLPLISRANVLLSSGQFNEAAKIYSEAIEQSPADYLLYYKRATAYLSLSRHSFALDDFDKVLALTAGTFDNAHLMKARIHLRDGHYAPARAALAAFTKSPGAHGTDTQELAQGIEEGERMQAKMEKERRAQLWNACADSATAALRAASHSIDIRYARAECALAAGDIDVAVGDLTRLSQLLPPSTPLLTSIVRLSYFLLPQSPAPHNTLKQCLHYDPDSSPCLALRRLLKSFDRALAKLDDLQAQEDWKGVLALLSPDFMRSFDDALKEHIHADRILPLTLSAPSSPSPSSTPSAKPKKRPPIPLLSAHTHSPARQTLVRALCRAATHLRRRADTERWCEELLRMAGCAADVDGLVGRADALLAKEDWEEAIRVLEQAWEASGGGRRDIQQRLQRAQKMLKQSKQKDYYKVMDVGRDADQKTIKAAFRREAKKAHPDRGGTVAKMAALNEAYEVLSKPELRERYDNGDDPNDPASQPGGPGPWPFPGGFAQGGHPFAQFFQQSGGSPGQGGFQFHFTTNGRR